MDWYVYRLVPEYLSLTEVETLASIDDMADLHAAIQAKEALVRYESRKSKDGRHGR